MTLSPFQLLSQHCCSKRSHELWLIEFLAHLNFLTRLFSQPHRGHFLNFFNWQKSGTSVNCFCEVRLKLCHCDSLTMCVRCGAAVWRLFVTALQELSFKQASVHTCAHTHAGSLCCVCSDSFIEVMPNSRCGLISESWQFPVNNSAGSLCFIYPALCIEISQNRGQHSLVLSSQTHGRCYVGLQ